MLQEQRVQQEQERNRVQHDSFAGADDSVWNQLGSRSATPDRVTSPPTYTGTAEYGGQKLSTAINKPFAAINGTSNPKSNQQMREGEEDLLAAFDTTTLANTSTKFPALKEARSRSHNGGGRGVENALIFEDVNGKHVRERADSDSDPFGLGTGPVYKATQTVPALTNGDEDDDVLGLLGRPVSQLPQPRPPSSSRASPPAANGRQTSASKAVAELVDMGFSPKRSRDALLSTDTGLNIQAAVGILLSEAREASGKQSSTVRSKTPWTGEESDSKYAGGPIGSTISQPDNSLPVWMQQQSRAGSSQPRSRNKSPAIADKEHTKYTTELSTSLLKTANSLWKTGTKKLNEAVADFNSDSDSSQPKWMREVESERKSGRSGPQQRLGADDEEQFTPTDDRKSSGTGQTRGLTDEAMMLESRPEPRKRVQPPKVERRSAYSSDSSRDQSPAVAAGRSTPTTQSSMAQQPAIVRGRSKLSRQAVEDEIPQAYISPARRERTTPKPLVAEPDLLFDASREATSGPRPGIPRTAQAQPRVSTSLPTRSLPPPRKVPHLSPIALQSSTSHRQAGTAAFKLGNYAQANSSYSASLSSLPSSHPLTIVLLTNRALTHLKTGDPKASIADTDAALETIGPSRGQGEIIQVDGEEGNKEMFIYWGKAMMRRAEALEQLERWDEAAGAWKSCVEAGVGGHTSIQGRNRSEKASGHGPVTTSTPTTVRPLAQTSKTAPARTRPRVSALDDLSGRPVIETAASAEAVLRLRAVNAEADRIDDERFRLADTVDERVQKWRGGKEGNLRALLSSLDTVLWEGSGWTKVGMGDLIVPGKVKVHYMKGIGKVHPDKVCGFLFSFLAFLCRDFFVPVPVSVWPHFFLVCCWGKGLTAGFVWTDFLVGDDGDDGAGYG